MRRLFISLGIGAALGLLIGVYLGWGSFPVQTVESQMRSLSAADKDRYTVMVAEAYEQDGDSAEAIRRLQPLGVQNVPQYVRDVTERFISSSGSGSESDIRHLVALSRALGYFTPPMQGFVSLLPTPHALSYIPSRAVKGTPQ